MQKEKLTNILIVCVLQNVNTIASGNKQTNKLKISFEPLFTCKEKIKAFSIDLYCMGPPKTFLHLETSVD